MKTIPPNLSPTTTKPCKKDPFHRLSSAVKKLDQLINRAHQLSTFSETLLHDETTGPTTPDFPSNLPPQTHHRSSIEGKTEKNMK